MSATQNQPGVSPIEHARGLHLRGERDAALQLVLSSLRAAPVQLEAAALLSRLLLDAQRATSAGELAARLVDAFIRRADLPRAWVAAQLALEAGGYADDALRRIASTFGKGSPRLSSAGAKPPPLPSGSAELRAASNELPNLSGPALLDAAEAAATRFLDTPDPEPADAPVPELPLFSALTPARLLKLLGRMELREFDTSSAVLEQGALGREAFVIARGVARVIRKDPPGAPVSLAVLGPGAVFGEMALVSQAPRAAAVVAAKPLQLLVIARQALEQLAAEDPAIGRELGSFCYGRMVSNLIRHSAILSPLDSAERQALIGRFTSQRFEPGQHLVSQGDELAHLYLIASGAVQVSRDADGERTVLAQLGPGQVVGEISLVLRKPATAEVVALTPTIALALSRDQFHEAIRNHPALLRELYDIAVQREEETRSVLAQKALDVSDAVLL